MCQTPKAPKEMYVEGEILLIFDSKITEQEATNIVESFGLVIIAPVKCSVNYFIVKVPAGEEFVWIETFHKNKHVISASVNVIAKTYLGGKK